MITFNLSDYLNLPTETGIYAIFNIKNNKIYVGSAANYLDKHGGIKGRFYSHVTLLKNNAHRNQHLQRSFINHGLSNFKIAILEFCNPDDCIKREQFYLDALEPEYNICKIANSTLGTKMSNEAIEKLASAKALPFKFLDKDKNIVEGSNLRKFCRLNGVDSRRMYQLNLGEIKRHKNFFALDELYIPFRQKLYRELESRREKEWLPSKCSLCIQAGRIMYRVRKTARVKGKYTNLFCEATTDREKALEIALLISQIWD